MAYVSVPKDLSKVKTKMFFNLTKRQIICFGGGALIGIPLFFMLRKPFGSSTATLLMIISMLPFFLLAMYEKSGQPLERYLQQMIRQRFLLPAKRPYRIENFYVALQQQIAFESEVRNIVCKEEKSKLKPKKPETDQGC